jgi:hypothetical protein
MNKEHYEKVQEHMNHHQVRTREPHGELWLYSVKYYRPFDRDKPETKTLHEEHWVSDSVEAVWKRMEREWGDELVDFDAIVRQVPVIGVILAD